MKPAKPSPCSAEKRTSKRGESVDVPADWPALWQEGKTGACTSPSLAPEIEQQATPALALALAVDAADRHRREAEWLASKLASYGHAPAKAEGRSLPCGHRHCRDGCAYCWLTAAEHAATVPEPKRKRMWTGQGRI